MGDRICAEQMRSEPVSDGTQRIGVGSDWVKHSLRGGRMTTRPAAPDPQNDRHVAFPGDPPAGGLPPTAWAPDPGTRVPGPRPRRSSAGWWVVAAFFALPVVGSAMHSDGMTSDRFAQMPMNQDRGAAYVDLTEIHGAKVSGVSPTDLPTHAVPPGTKQFRLEVVGGDPRATITVDSQGPGHGAGTQAPDVTLPYSGLVTFDEPPETLMVGVAGADGQYTVQCRLYADDELVAIQSGDGGTECVIHQS